jgi:integrase
MATVKFLIKGKGDNNTIYVRLRDGRDTDVTISTGYTIESKFWSISKGEPKQSAEHSNKLNLSNDLRKLKVLIIDKLNEDKGKTTINKDWLTHVIDVFKNPSIDSKQLYLLDAISNYQEALKHKSNVHTGRKTSPQTIRGFNTTMMRLEKFQEYKKHNYLLHEIDLTFHDEYKKFASINLELATNSYGTDLKRVKTVCLDARDRGFEINKQLESRKFNAPSEPTTFVTLTETEIHAIKKHNFKLNYLQNARDWLIIGCWTGCRVNDLMKLSNENIMHTPKGQKFIRYTQSKTGKQVDIPVHDQVNEVLERLEGFPRPISDVKFNEYIKTVCKQVGLTQIVSGTRQNPTTHKKENGSFQKWELVKSHTCRRSFATNHYNKLPNKLIMAVTGHATERMLLSYIGETENDHIEDFMQVWGMDKEEQDNTLKMAN